MIQKQMHIETKLIHAGEPKARIGRSRYFTDIPILDLSIQ
jgi:hypothetical protein